MPSATPSRTGSTASTQHPSPGGGQPGQAPGELPAPELTLGDSWRREECAPISWVRETISLYIKLTALI